MSVSCRDAETAKIWSGERSRKLPPDIQAKALMKLRLLGAAKSLDDLRIPPGNRLEALRGDGRVSIRSGSTSNGASASAGPKEGPLMSKSSITTDDLLPNPHAGEILLAEFLQPMGLSQSALARAIGVPPRRINEIVLGKRAVTAGTDLRLARYFSVSEGFFLGLQAEYDLLEAKRTMGAKLAAIVPRAA